MEKTSCQPECPTAPVPSATRRKRNKNTNDTKESETTSTKSSIVESEKNIKMLETKVSGEKPTLSTTSGDSSQAKVSQEADRTTTQARSRSIGDRQRDISRSKMALQAFRERSRSKASGSVSTVGTTSTDSGLPDRLSKLVPSSSEETFFTTAQATPR